MRIVPVSVAYSICTRVRVMFLEMNGARVHLFAVELSRREVVVEIYILFEQIAYGTYMNAHLNARI